MPLDQLFERRQNIRRRAETTKGRPRTFVAGEPRRTVKATPVVRRLRQLRLLNYRLGKTLRIKIPKTRNERQQQSHSIALINHQRLLAVPVVINDIVRWCVADFERIKKKRDGDRNRVSTDRRSSREALIVKSRGGNRLEIIVETSQPLAHASTQIAIDVDREIDRFDIRRQEIAREP